MPNVERDHALERELLDRIQAPNAMVEQVLERLGRFEGTNGNTGWERPPVELVDEMLEEAADIAGWGIGAALQLDEPLRSRLAVAMALGRAAWCELEELRQLLRS